MSGHREAETGASGAIHSCSDNDIIDTRHLLCLPAKFMCHKPVIFPLGDCSVLLSSQSWRFAGHDSKDVQGLFVSQSGAALTASQQHKYYSQSICTS